MNNAQILALDREISQKRLHKDQKKDVKHLRDQKKIVTRRNHALEKQ